MHSFDSTKEIKKKLKRKIVHDNESVTESNDEYTDSNIDSSDSQSTRILKESKEMLSRNNSINSSTEKRKKRSMFE